MRRVRPCIWYHDAWIMISNHVNGINIFLSFFMSKEDRLVDTRFYTVGMIWLDETVSLCFSKTGDPESHEKHVGAHLYMHELCTCALKINIIKSFKDKDFNNPMTNSENICKRKMSISIRQWVRLWSVSNWDELPYEWDRLIIGWSIGAPQTSSHKTYVTNFSNKIFHIKLPIWCIQHYMVHTSNHGADRKIKSH